jgi:hypothetical protein
MPHEKTIGFEGGGGNGSGTKRNTKNAFQLSGAARKPMKPLSHARLSTNFQISPRVMDRVSLALSVYPVSLTASPAAGYELGKTLQLRNHSEEERRP